MFLPVETLFPYLVGSLADTIAQVVHTGTHGDGFTVYFDFLDIWAMDGKHPFHTFAKADPTNGEAFMDSASLSANDDPGKYLDTLLVAFPYPSVYPDPVADLELAPVGL